MRRYDAIVVGLGGMGSAAAAHLAERGLSVLGLEQFRRAHDLGSSHGGSRIIRQSYFEGPDYVPLILRAYELWDRLTAFSGRKLRLETGALYVAPAGSDLVADTLASGRAHGLPVEELGPAEVRARFPTFARMADHEVAAYEAVAGIVFPEVSVRTHCVHAERNGATLHFDEAVRGWTARGDGVEVTTARASYAADRLVVTAGPWAGQVLADLGLPLRVERAVQLWLAPAERRPWLADRHPVWIWETETGQRPYGFPLFDASPKAAKVAFFREATPADVRRVDRAVADADVAPMRDALRPRLPQLADAELADANVCLYTTTPDEHFVIGLHPDAPQVAIAAGFSGHGFKFVPVVGEILADLVIDGSTPHPIAQFAPTRFTRGDEAPEGIL